MLIRTYSEASSVESLRKAANAFLTAAKWYQETGLSADQASCYWKAAQTFEKLQAYSIATENYGLASRAYQASSAKKSQLRDFYRDLAIYTSACGKVTIAKQQHTQLQFELASKLYNDSAALLRKTQRWSFLIGFPPRGGEPESERAAAVNLDCVSLRQFYAGLGDESLTKS